LRVGEILTNRGESAAGEELESAAGDGFRLALDRLRDRAMDVVARVRGVDGPEPLGGNEA
jgi:hypothetical protein